MWADPRYQRYDDTADLAQRASEFDNKFTGQIETAHLVKAQKCLRACITKLRRWVSWRGGMDAAQHIDVIDEVIKKLP